MDIAELLHPARTALVLSECQNGVLGNDAVFPELARAAAPIVPTIARLTKAARAAGVPVIHCLALRRPDGMGSNTNARLFGAARKASVKLTPGSHAAAVLDAIGVTENDFVSTRLHGLGPMAGTDLEPILRNLGARTIVCVGASVNVAITNLVMDAVNAGMHVVLPRDCIAGVPTSYADAVIENTLSLLATVTTSDEVIAAWPSA